MQNSMDLEKLKCQCYLSCIKASSFLTEHSFLLQVGGQAASTHILPGATPHLRYGRNACCLEVSGVAGAWRECGVSQQQET